jgi:hypothetical protein
LPGQGMNTCNDGNHNNGCDEISKKSFEGVHPTSPASHAALRVPDHRAPSRTASGSDYQHLAMGASGAGGRTLLQGLPRGPVGSRLLAPSNSTGIYLAPSLLAVKTGGLPLV